MKKKFKSILFALAALVLAAGCSKESGGDINGETQSVRITVSGYTAPQGRAEGSPVANNAPVTFNSGYIYFVSQSELIVKKLEVATTGTTDYDLDKVVMSDLAAGENIPNVPGSAKYVYIIGNVPSGATIPAVGDGITAINDLAVSVISQFDATGGVANVSLWGMGDIDKDPITEDLEAEVEIYPIAARLEIGKITTSSAVIEEFQVDGIFINNYYASIGLGGKTATPAIDNGDDTDLYEGGSIAYPDSGAGNLEEILYDYNLTNGIGSGLADVSASESVEPATSGKVWAYNLLAPTAIGASGTPEAPRVIIRISNIKATANQLYENETWYLTTSLVFTPADNDNKEYFLPGKVYSIADLVFDHSNLTTEPEQEDVPVKVTAKLMTWTTQNLGYEFGN